MGFWDNLTEGLTSSDAIGAGITGIAGLIGNYFKPEASQPYSSTEEAYNAQLQLQYAQLEQQASQSAAQIAAQLEAAGISSKAALAAANIQAAAMLKKAKIDAAVQIGALRERAMADQIAQKISAVKGSPEILAAAAQNKAATRANVGNVAQQGLGNTANVLAAFRR